MVLSAEPAEPKINYEVVTPPLTLLQPGLEKASTENKTLAIERYENIDTLDINKK